MCGRFTSIHRSAEIAERFGVRLSERAEEGYRPRFNIAPGQEILAVRAAGDDGARQADALHWGLVPHWAKERAGGPKLINARAETLAERAAFRGLLRRNRCLVPADGFYEWQADAQGRRRPVRFTLADGSLFAFAGLWSSWSDPATGEPLLSCTIVTTGANELVATVHDRMPVVLEPTAEADWLDPATPQEHALALLRPLPADRMRGRPASPLVNSVRNEGPELLEASEPDGPGGIPLP